MKPIDDLSRSKLSEVLEYNPVTGQFVWRSDGTYAGTKVKGYIAIRVGLRRYYAHRLAWLYVKGVWPVSQIDHINRNKSDNRIANLRQATASQNQGNRTAPCNNKSGIRGVRFDKARDKWYADIRKNGRTQFLGRYDTAEEATAVYSRAAQEQFGEFICQIR